MILLLFLCFSTKISAQSELDSMKALLKDSGEDTTRVLILDDLGWMLKSENPDRARAYLQEAIALSEKLNYQRGLSKAWNDLGVVETIHNNIPEAIEANNKALEVREAMNDKKGIASVYNNLAGIYDEQGEYGDALSNYIKSQNMRKELRDTARIARLNYNIGLVHEKMGNYVEAQKNILEYMIYGEEMEDDEILAYANNMMGNIEFAKDGHTEALKYYRKAEKLFKNLEYDMEHSSAINNIGSTLGDMAEVKVEDEKFDEAKILFDSAIFYVKQALEIRERIEDEGGMGEAYNNLGTIYKDLGSYFEKIDQPSNASQRWNIALNYFRKGAEAFDKIDYRKGQLEVLNGYGDVYRRLKDYPTAKKNTNEMLVLALEIGDKRFESNAYKDLSKIYAEVGDYKTAYKFERKYNKLRYKIVGEESSKQLQYGRAKYNLDQQEMEVERQQSRNALLNAKIERASIVRNSLIGGTAALFLLAMLLYNRYRIKTKANEALEEKNEIINNERKRSDDLLLNILPETIAEELKSHGFAKARKHESVSVLFSDFKGFTTIAEKLTPEELVAELDACFRGFDAIMDKYKIEKIKTIGDAYMAVGGLADENTSHPTDVINAALEMQDFMDKRRKNQETFEMRIGIHTGSVVSGVVGNRKFAYDIWGDAVNLAARMESSGQPGKVNISEDTSLLVNGQFSLIPRGKVAAKNKGEVEMFFVKKNRE